ncbi:hypothetical protein Godav_014721 [Gossypium davidsonii]|uniref:Uncharacterized protein n=1 Tax=Gossypium davidsonii TaxID=34287 RepID=A0A7J8RM55_GOSDV|nr:hypothetical protein [Gossypium davidsonii]
MHVCLVEHGRWSSAFASKNQKPKGEPIALPHAMAYGTRTNVLKQAKQFPRDT